MKRIFYISLMVLIVAAVSCKKKGNDINPLSDVKQLGIGSYLVLDSTLASTMVPTNASSKVGVIVHQYPGSQDVESIVVYTNAGAPTSDTTKWRKVKTIS